MIPRRERRTGRYAPSVERPCKCGHTLAEHDAERVKVGGVTLQECQHPGCECECYTRPRAPKSS